MPIFPVLPVLSGTFHGRRFRRALALCLAAGMTACDLQTPPSGEVAGPARVEESAEPAMAPYEGIPLPKIVGSSLLFRTGFEDEDQACWDNRLASGMAKGPCGHWSDIGPSETRLTAGPGVRAGRKSLDVTFLKDESRGGATLSLFADRVNVRAYFRFAKGFDFGQGIKVGRVRAYNRETQANDIDIVLVVRSATKADQCGIDDMADLGLYYNGRPVGYDWGHIIAPMKFERDRWYAVEYQVILNTPGAADGSVRLWVDGRQVAMEEKINLRGKAGAETKLNKIMLGGWYSNGGSKNPCPDPDGPSVFSMDDVAVGTEYIGP